MSIFTRFFKDESGATAIEYGLIAALLSLLIIGGLTVAGPALQNVFNTIGNTLAAAVPAAP